MAKRAATTELNHENWNVEDEPEEPGVFQRASSEVLETRVIKTAKRQAKKQTSDSSSDSKPSPFSRFTGFGSTTLTSNLKSPFSFLSQNQAKVSDDGDQNGAKEENKVSSLTKDAQPPFKSFTNSIFSSGVQKDSLNFSSGTTQNTISTDTTFKPFEHIFKTSKTVENDKDGKTKNLELLKDLNLSCSSWISENLEKNPFCILTPIFKDYEKHLAQLGLDTYSNKKDIDTSVEKTNTNNNSITESTKSNNSAKEDSTRADSPQKNEGEKKPAEFKFQSLQSNSPFTFQFGSGSTTFGATNSPFSLNQIAAKPAVAESECKNDEEDSEEPPKNDFVAVVEEDSVFDIKCKVFVKKDGNFISRGVGTLFLKPVKDSKKTQLIVRAHTSLGNILLNVLLVPGMPVQKTGKNNAMIVCIPTPESKPPPVPVLIRVKTSEECDNLIKKLEECKGS